MVCVTGSNMGHPFVDEAFEPSTAARASAATKEATQKEECNGNNNNGKGLPWWKLARPARSGKRRSLLGDISNDTSESSGSGSSSNNSSSSKRFQQGEQQGLVAPSSAERLLFGCDASLTASSSSSADLDDSGRFASAPGKQHCSNKRHQQQTWTSRTEAPSPPEDDHNTIHEGSSSPASAATTLLIPPTYNGAQSNDENYSNSQGIGEATSTSSSSCGRGQQRQPQPMLSGSESAAPPDEAASPGTTRPDLSLLECHPISATAAMVAGVTSASPGTPTKHVETTDSWSDMERADKSHSHSGRSRRQQQEQLQRTPSKPPHGQQRPDLATTVNRRKEGRTDSGNEAGMSSRGVATNVGSKSLTRSASSLEERRCDEEREAEGMDDDVALGMDTEPSMVYDILAVDRGCGYCDTSVVPFPVEEGGEVATGRMRAVMSGQSEFLARRGFAAGLVSHFLEETNCEFRVLQGGASRGMNSLQLEEAAVSLEEAFVPAVKRLRGNQSMDVVLDSLFKGADDAGQFVVRFEVSITRCHPEDLDGSSSPALRECARAIRDAVRDEGVSERATHEVVFVGRPMWELVLPVLDLAGRPSSDKGQ